MDDALAVCVSERIRHLLGELQCAVHAQLDLPPQTVPERLSTDVRHSVPELARGVAGVEDRENVRVLQAGGDADLAEEAVRTQGRCELGVDNLERDGAVVAKVAREVNRGHAAPPELALDRVAVGQGGSKVVEGVGQQIIR